MPPNGRTLPKRTDSLRATTSTSENSILSSLQDELHDVRRVQAYGQEEDLKEALSRMIAKVEEMATQFSQVLKTQIELETALKLARSNLQLALANNEMLEEALKRDSVGGGKDVGWRRWSETPDARKARVAREQSSEFERTHAHARQASGDVSASASPLPSPPSASTPTVEGPSAPNSPANPSTSPPASSDSKFFRFRFGSSPSGTSSPRLSNSGTISRPQTPPMRSRADELREREASHLTSASLPSLVASTSKREEELVAQLESERDKYTKVCKEKASLEQELEGLSQALFEEANKMVAQERIKCAETEEELKQIRKEKEALKSAMQIVEEENLRLKTPSLSHHSQLAQAADLEDNTPRGSRPVSRAGPSSSPSSPKLSAVVTPLPDEHTSDKVSESEKKPQPATSPPSKKQESPAQERTWTPPDVFTLPKSPLPDLPVEESPWAG